jgi:hypothetical protein
VVYNILVLNNVSLIIYPLKLRLWFCMQEDSAITMTHENTSVETSHRKVIVEHCDIIKPDFWEAHPSILDEKPPSF